jgi:hypothetical protein
LLLLWTQYANEQEEAFLPVNLLLSNPHKGPEEHISSSAIIYPPPLDCDDFLRGICHNSSTSSAVAVRLEDPNDQKVFANYMTNYDPPFWISNHHDDRLTFRTGHYDSDIYNHTRRLEEIVKSTPGNKMVFVNVCDDWGWYPLLGASKGKNVVVVAMLQQPANSEQQGNKHSIHFC